MRVAVAHNAIPEGEQDPSTLDVLDQAQYVAATLKKLGHQARLFPIDRGIVRSAAAIVRWKAGCVFNLVESIENCTALHPYAAGVWEVMGLPHTGCPARALEYGTNKHTTKVLMRAAGIATPEWGAVEDGHGSWEHVPGPWILKPGLEDASVGIEEDSVIFDRAKVPAKIEELKSRFPGQPVLIEQYIDGREFNISVLGGKEGPRVMPAAEMIFANYPPGKVKILGFRSKWVEGAFEYENTLRSFEFAPQDDALLAGLRDVALRCWRLFDLHGYARVDVRVDSQSNIHVMEINANPCISPNAGFVAAVAQAGLSAEAMVQCILEDCVCVPRPSTT